MAPHRMSAAPVDAASHAVIFSGAVGAADLREEEKNQCASWIVDTSVVIKKIRLPSPFASETHYHHLQA
jgi:hypothetical protein